MLAQLSLKQLWPGWVQQGKVEVLSQPLLAPVFEFCQAGKILDFGGFRQYLIELVCDGLLILLFAHVVVGAVL